MVKSLHIVSMHMVTSISADLQIPLPIIRKLVYVLLLLETLLFVLRQLATVLLYVPRLLVFVLVLGTLAKTFV
jgi:hypothetical protein